MQTPVNLIDFAEGDIKVCEGISLQHGDCKENDGFMKFIKHRGEETAAMLKEPLANAKPFMSKIESLRTKGELLHFDDFDSTSIACERLMNLHVLI